MRPWIAILFPALILACEKDDTGVEYGILEGTINIEDGETAILEATNVFGYDQGGVAVVYFAGNSAATCEDVVAHLDSGDSADPTSLFDDDSCNLFAQIQDFDSGGSSYDSNFDGDTWTKVTWALNCALGDGDFEYEYIGQDSGYYWSGRWWQGGPDTWNLTASGGGGDGIVIEAEMNDYDGDYIYEFEDATASGLVSGTTLATWCEELSETGFFTN